MILRTDAGLNFEPRREMVRDATGSPVSMYSWTIECRISAVRDGREDL